MSALLNQAIATLHLQPGQTYRTTVDGHVVELRMLDRHRPSIQVEAPNEIADMVMLQPWFTIPDAPAVQILHPQIGPPDVPDPPHP